MRTKLRLQNMGFGSWYWSGGGFEDECFLSKVNLALYKLFPKENIVYITIANKPMRDTTYVLRRKRRMLYYATKRSKLGTLRLCEYYLEALFRSVPKNIWVRIHK